MNDKQPLAWQVSNYDDEVQSVIVFHYHGLAARRLGAGEVGCDEDSDADIQRKPEYDQYAEEGKVPMYVLFDDGWRFECSSCYQNTCKDYDGMVIDDEVYCEECRTAYA